jgi:hypothetical protein
MPDQVQKSQSQTSQASPLPVPPKQQVQAQNQATVNAPAIPKPQDKKQFGRKKNGILFIARQQFFLYVDGMQSVVTFPFTPDIVSDLDVINEELLEQRIAALTQQHQIPSANFIVILANTTLFSKQVTATDISQKKVDEEKFLNTIPFEAQAVRNIIMGPNTYTVVANQQLFGPISYAFKAVGSEFTLVLPEFLFGKELNLAQGLTVVAAQDIMKKAQEFKSYSFIRKEEIHQVEVSSSDGEVQDNKLKLQMHGGKSNRMFVVSGLMVMLVGVLIAAFLFIQQSNTPPEQKAVVLEAPTPTASPTVPVLEGQLATDSASPSTPSATVQGDTSSDITIQYTQNNTRKAYLLTERLRKLGFSTITPQIVLVSQGDSQIAFRPSVSSAVAEVLITEVEKQIGAVSMQRSNAISDDVVIFVGNN